MSIERAEMSVIKRGGELIKRGEVVAFPTETVYGLGADAFNAIALAKIFEVKQRPHFDPLIVHVADIETVKKIAYIDNENVYKLMERFWPGPLTIVLRKKECIPYIATSGLETVAVRMPAHETALELIRNSNGAVAAPSANPFGYLSPTTAQHVFEQLGKKVELIIDGGACSVGVESTIVDMTQEMPIVLRPGGMAIEKLQEVLGNVEVFNRKIETVTVPGQLPSHYAPRIPLYIVKKEKMEEMLKDEVFKYHSKKQGLLLFSDFKLESEFGAVEYLTKNGDINEAASNLFICLHRIDNSGVEEIFAEWVPEEGVGKAIMDRLYKASVKE